MKAYPAYKDSGCVWIDKIPEHWSIVALKHLVSPKITDGPHETPVFVDDGVPFVSAEAVQGGRINFDSRRGNITREQHEIYSQKCLPQRDDIFFVKSGATTGKLAYVDTDREFGIWSPLALIRAKKVAAYSKYLFQSLGARYFQSQVQTFWSYGTQPNIGMGVIENLRIILPPLPEQQAIADFLDCKTAQIDTLIEKKQRQINLLQEQRTALINHAVTKGLNPDAPIRDSGVEWLGDIPSHWDVMKIAYFVDKITNGYVGPTRDILVDRGVRYIQSLHIKKNTIDFHKPYYVSQEWSNGHERTILRENDVLVVQTGAIGEVGIVPKEFDGANCHALIILRVKDELGYGKFLLYALTSKYGYHSMLSIMTGALHPHLNTTYLRDIYLAVPPKREQQEIIEYIENKTREIDLTIKKHNDTISLLREYRTALISEAVTGKIDVREWRT